MRSISRDFAQLAVIGGVANVRRRVVRRIALPGHLPARTFRDPTEGVRVALAGPRYFVVAKHRVIAVQVLEMRHTTRHDRRASGKKEKSLNHIARLLDPAI